MATVTANRTEWNWGRDLLNTVLKNVYIYNPHDTYFKFLATL